MPTIALVGGAVVGAGGSIYNASQANSAKKQQAGALGNLYNTAAGNSADIFGTKPEFSPVDYQNLFEKSPGYQQMVSDVLSGDQQNLPAASQLSGDISKAISSQALSRIKGWDPSFQASMSQLENNRNAVLQGHLPYSDALDIAGDRGRLANDLGYGGGQGPQVAKDLGLKRLDLMSNVGPNLANSVQSILGQVDPISRHPTPMDFLITPREAVPWMIQENQFGANFGLQQNLEQAAFDAMPDPQAQGLFQLQALQAGLGGAGGAAGGGMGGMLQGLGPAPQGLSRGFSGGTGAGFGGQQPYSPYSGQGLYQTYGGQTPYGTANQGFWPGNSNIYVQPNNQAVYLGDQGMVSIPQALPYGGGY